MPWLKPRPTKISRRGNGCPVPLRGTGRYKFTNQIHRQKTGEPAGRRRYHSQRQTNSDRCPVPLRGTGRYRVKNKFKGKSNGAGGTPALRRSKAGYFTFRTSRVRSSKGWAPPEKASTSSRILSAMPSELSW